MERFRRVALAGILSGAGLGMVLPHSAAAIGVGSETILFDEVVSGVPFFNYDSNDADTATDVVFSTTDPGGFNQNGPGPQQLYIDEPGLEGTTALSTDLRVDFLQGAVGQVSFGFALINPGQTTFTTYNAPVEVVGVEPVVRGGSLVGNLLPS